MIGQADLDGEGARGVHAVGPDRDDVADDFDAHAFDGDLDFIAHGQSVDEAFGDIHDGIDLADGDHLDHAVARIDPLADFDKRAGHRAVEGCEDGRPLGLGGGAVALGHRGVEAGAVGGDEGALVIDFLGFGRAGFAEAFELVEVALGLVDLGLGGGDVGLGGFEVQVGPDLVDLSELGLAADHTVAFVDGQVGDLTFDLRGHGDSADLFQPTHNRHAVLQRFHFNLRDPHRRGRRASAFGRAAGFFRLGLGAHRLNPDHAQRSQNQPRHQSDDHGGPQQTVRSNTHESVSRRGISSATS